MTFIISYSANVNQTAAKGLALARSGRNKNLIRESPSGKLDFYAFFCPTAYNGNTSISYGSLSDYYIYGDAESGEAGFLTNMGLIFLSIGENGIALYDNMTPENKALYESVKPPIKVVDSEGNETGETRFNYHTVVDGGI